MSDTTAVVGTKICPVARTERKLAQILEGARAVFIKQGFDGASVDDIAQTAGISKATLYRHFPDKTALFRAVVEYQCEQFMAQFPCIEACGRPLPEMLKRVARTYIDFVFSDDATGLYRIAVSEAVRQPAIGRMFYESGPSHERHVLIPVLTAAADRGELTIPDPPFASEMFFAMCTAGLMNERLLSIKTHYSAREIDEQATRAVTAFVHAFQYRDPAKDSAA